MVSVSERKKGILEAVRLHTKIKIGGEGDKGERGGGESKKVEAWKKEKARGYKVQEYFHPISSSFSVLEIYVLPL